MAKLTVVRTAVIGYVKSVQRSTKDPSKDFGFIQPEGEIEGYNSGIHFNVLRSERHKQVWNKTCYPDPHIGDRVRFDVVLDKSGRETCVNVVKIGRAEPRPTTAKADPVYRAAASAVAPTVPASVQAGMRSLAELDEEEEDEDLLPEEGFDEVESYAYAEYDDDYHDTDHRSKNRKTRKGGSDDE